MQSDPLRQVEPCLLLNNSADILFEHFETWALATTATTNQVKRLLQKGITPANLAIVVCSNRHNEAIAHNLKLHDIPLQQVTQLPLTQVALVKHLLLMLQYLSVPEHSSLRNELLFKTLHLPFLGIPHTEVARLAGEVALTRYNRNTTTLHQLLHKKVMEVPYELFYNDLSTSLGHAVKMLWSLCFLAPGMSLLQTYETIVKECEIESYIRKSSNEIDLHNALNAFGNIITHLATVEPKADYQTLLQHLAALESEKSLPSVSRKQGDKSGIGVYDEDCFEAQNITHLIVTGADEMPTTFIRKLSGNYNAGKLGYVLCCHTGEEHSVVNKPAHPFAAMLPIDASVQTNNDDPLASTNLEPVTEYNNLVQVAPLPTAVAGQLLSRFVMSVSALNNFLQCPLLFYFNNVLRVSSGSSEAAVFGCAVHFALQRLFEHMQAGRNEVFDKGVLLKSFDDYMQGQRGDFTPGQFKQRLQQGSAMLNQYFYEYQQQWNPVVSIERNISNVLVNGIHIKGKIDKLEFVGNDVTIVDYKTGSYEKTLKRLSPPDDDQPDGGSYWRQAVFYTMLIKYYQNKKWQVVSTVFDFVQPAKDNTFKKHVLRIAPQDVATVTHQLTSVWGRIKQHDFYTGCGKPNCHWCAFVGETRNPL